MALFLIALVIFCYVIWRGGEQRGLKRGDWRTGAGLLAIGCFVAAAFLAVRMAWPEAAALLAIACALLLSARSERGHKPAPRMATGPARADRLTMTEAREILGVDEGATVEDIRAAYARHMRTAHPDHGGTHGLAAQLNAARDRLLGRSGTH